MKAPATLDEFYRMFPTERRCWEVLRRVRWPHGFRCPRCEGRKAHRLRARGPWQCAVCRYQVDLDAYLTEWLAFTLDVQYILPTGDLEEWDYVSVDVGLMYRFYSWQGEGWHCVLRFDSWLNW